jgi:hypothetical protein
MYFIDFLCTLSLINEMFFMFVIQFSLISEFNPDYKGKIGKN